MHALNAHLLQGAAFLLRSRQQINQPNIQVAHGNQAFIRRLLPQLFIQPSAFVYWPLQSKG